MTLKDQVKEFVEFDDREYDRPELNLTEYIYISKGAATEHSRLAPLLNLLPEIVEALERLEFDGFANQNDHALLAKIKEVVGGKK